MVMKVSIIVMGRACLSRNTTTMWTVELRQWFSCNMKIGIALIVVVPLNSNVMTISYKGLDETDVANGGILKITSLIHVSIIASHLADVLPCCLLASE